jgi:hypothetical protein
MNTHPQPTQKDTEHRENPAVDDLRYEPIPSPMFAVDRRVDAFSETDLPVIEL